MKQLLFIIGILVFCYACQKTETYPIEPAITYKSVYINNDTVDALDQKIRVAEVTLTLKDGDGDIGFDSLVVGDSTYRSSIFTQLYIKKNGVFEKVESNTDLQNFKIPYIAQSTGQNKTIKADVKVKFEYTEIELPQDTIKFDIYLIDRELHKSNIITTPEIIFK